MDFDLIVIGGGSGGLAAARRASEYGAKSAVIESHKLGGTCVNVGCVPKKVMWTTSRIAEVLHDAPDYGFNVDCKGFEWSKIKSARDSYIARLNGIYETNLEKASVTYLSGQARFESSDTVRVGDKVYRASYILIATGSEPGCTADSGCRVCDHQRRFFRDGTLARKGGDHRSRIYRHRIRRYAARAG